MECSECEQAVDETIKQMLLLSFRYGREELAKALTQKTGLKE